MINSQTKDHHQRFSREDHRQIVSKVEFQNTIDAWNMSVEMLKIINTVGLRRIELVGKFRLVSTHRIDCQMWQINLIE